MGTVAMFLAVFLWAVGIILPVGALLLFPLALSWFSGIVVNQLEVYLLLYHIHTFDTNVHRRTEFVGFAGFASNDLVVVLVKHIVVAFEGGDRYHALAFVALDFGIDAPLADTGYESREDLTQLVAKVFSLLVFDTGTLGIGSFLLHLGAMFAVFLIFFGIDRLAPMKVIIQQPMNHKVRIPADRGSEVCVEGEGKAIMP